MFDMKAQKPNRKTAADSHIRFVEFAEKRPLTSVPDSSPEVKHNLNNPIIPYTTERLISNATLHTNNFII